MFENVKESHEIYGEMSSSDKEVIDVISADLAELGEIKENDGEWRWEP